MITEKSLKQTTKDIIALIRQGKTPAEIRDMGVGYPFGTARYWDMKINDPRKYAIVIAKQKLRMREYWCKKKAERVNKEVEEAESRLSPTTD